jgi:hypothetical protein
MAVDGQHPPKASRAGSRIPRPILKGKKTPTTKIQSATTSSVSKRGLQHGQISSSTALQDSGADFALKVVIALEATAKEIVDRYDHKGSTRYCGMLRMHLSQIRVWLEDNENAANPSYVSEILVALEDLCRVSWLLR